MKNLLFFCYTVLGYYCVNEVMLLDYLLLYVLINWVACDSIRNINNLKRVDEFTCIVFIIRGWKDV